MEIKLDKLEETILERLREQTGKSDEDLVKLALWELNRSMQNVQQQMQPVTIPMPYPVYPTNPYTPSPSVPTNPWQPVTEPYITWGTTSAKIS